MSIPTTLLSPTVFWTGAGAVRHHPAYGAQGEIRTRKPKGHQCLRLARLPFRHLRIWWAGLDLNQQRFQCHGFTDRLLQPFAYLPIWLQGRDSDPHVTAYEAGVLPVDYPAVLCPKVGAGVEERV